MDRKVPATEEVKEMAKSYIGINYTFLGSQLLRENEIKYHTHLDHFTVESALRCSVSNE